MGFSSRKRDVHTPDVAQCATLLCVIGLASVALAAAPPRPPCDFPDTKLLPFCNVALPLESRVADLVNRIPLNQTAKLFTNTAGGIDSLHLPPMEWWSEALHGVAWSPGVSYGDNVTSSTSFPQVCTTAATFNRTLFHNIGALVGKEARAMSNLGHAGLTFWSPNINIYRDPRWVAARRLQGRTPT